LFDRDLPLWLRDERDIEGFWFPAVDVRENDQEFIIKADLPDADEKDLSIQVQEGQLVLKGQRQSKREQKGERFYRSERRFGSFQRSFSLPTAVDADKVTAEYDKGVLTIHAPKTEAAKPRQIPISTPR
jgi:HSP20 family protein